MIRTPPVSPTVPAFCGPVVKVMTNKANCDNNMTSSSGATTPIERQTKFAEFPVSPLDECGKGGTEGMTSLDCLLADIKVYPGFGEAINSGILTNAELDLMKNPNLKLSKTAIGHGSYSYVYELTATGLVVKFATSKKKTNIILKEAVVLSRLNQRNSIVFGNKYNIVPFYGVTYICKSHFKRLRSDELVPGILLPKYSQNLQQFYQRTTNEIVFGNWWKMCSQMLLCLQFLETERVIHGDIKTANILVDSEFNCFLADFTSYREICETSFIVDKNFESTMEYCAPEMIKDFIKSPNTDLYALGLCFLALITKNEPFQEIQQSKNHGIGSIQQNQWLINAILKDDAINLNVLNNEQTYAKWSRELDFLKLILLERKSVNDCIQALPQFH